MKSSARRFGPPTTQRLTVVPFFAWLSCLIRSRRVGVLERMKTNPVPRTQPTPSPHRSQPMLPLEAAAWPQRIPDANRTKCVQLLCELLERVVLRAKSNHGGDNSER